MERLWELALSAEVVACAAGLDLSRDVATHFLQQKLFAAQLDLARRIRLPLVVHEKAAHAQVIDAVTAAHADATAADAESDWTFRVAVHAFTGSDEELAAFVRAGFFIMINGAACDLKAGPSSAEAAAAASEAPTSAAPSFPSAGVLPELAGEGASLFRQLRCGLLPVSRLLLCSDAPLHTPANIDDVHVRSQRNEPANLPFLYEVVAKALRIPATLLVDHIDRNTRTFFNLQYAHEQQQQPQQQLRAHSSEERKEGSHENAEEPPGSTGALPRASAENGKAASGSERPQKGKVAFAQNDSRSVESTSSSALESDVSRRLQQHRLDDGDDERKDGRTTVAKESSHDDGSEDDRTSGSDAEDAAESAGIDERASGTGTSGGQEPLSSRASSRPSAAASLPSALLPAGRRRHAQKRADDGAADDDWTVGRGRRRGHTGPAAAKAVSSAPASASASPADSEDEDADGSGAAPQRSASAERAARAVGSGVDLSLDRDVVRFACRRCRCVLFSEDDLLPHRSAAEQSRAEAEAAAAQAEGAAKGEARGRRTRLGADAVRAAVHPPHGVDAEPAAGGAGQWQWVCPRLRLRRCADDQ